MKRFSQVVAGGVGVVVLAWTTTACTPQQPGGGGAGTPSASASPSTAPSGSSQPTVAPSASASAPTTDTPKPGPSTAKPIKQTFRNPLGQAPDPFMVVYGGNYYLLEVGGPNANTIFAAKSASLATISSAPRTAIWKGDDSSRNKEIWAPSLSMFDGKWYLYFTADDGTDDHHRIYVSESDGADPLGPYHFKNKLEADNSKDSWAIDPVVLIQQSGNYLVWSGAGGEGHNMIYAAALSNPWTVTGPRTYIPADGSCPEVREAPAVVRHDSTNFLVYSTCDTGKPDYSLWEKSISVTADPLNADNWKSQGEVFARNDSAGVFGPGSNGFFKSPDGTEDWQVYHAKSSSEYTYGGRITRAKKVEWRADGTPDLGKPDSLNIDLVLPSGDPGK